MHQNAIGAAAGKPAGSALDLLLAEIVDAAIATSAADFGHVELIDPTTGQLRIVAQGGLPPWWVDFWSAEAAAASASGMVLQRGARIVVEDVQRDPLFGDGPLLDAQLRAGIRALQATPLIARSGKPVGVLSTHYRAPHEPGRSTLRLLDLLARQAAELIEHAQAEAALRESRRRLAATHESAPIGIVELSLDGKYVDVNGEFCRIVGYARHEVLGVAFWSLTHPEDRPRNVELFRRLTAGEIPSFRLEKRFVRKDGSLVWVEVRRTLVRDDAGEPLYVVGAILDITDRRAAESALRESEARFRHLASTLPQLVWETDAAGRCTFQGAQWEQWTGQPAETSLGLGWLDMIHPDDRARAMAEWQAAQREGDRYDSQYRFRSADGSYRWCVARAHGTRGPTGAIARWVGTTTDIDDIRRTEQALRESRETLQSFYDSAPMMMGIAELDGERTVAVSGNRAMARYLETVPDRLAGRTGPELGTSSDVERLWVESYRRSRETVAPVSFEYEERRAGGMHWLSATVAFLGIGPSGRPRFSFVAEDVTARKQAELRLAESEHRLRLAMAASATGMWDWNLDTGTVVWSPECYAAHGVREGEFGGTAEAFDAFLHPDDRERVWATVRMAAEQRTPYACDFRIVRPDGDVRWVTNLGLAVCDEKGRFTRMVGTINDITSRKQAEREREELVRQAERARAEAETSHHVLERVQRIVDATTGTLSLDELLEVLVELVQSTLQVDTVTVLLRNLRDDDEPEDDVLRVRASRGFSPGTAHADVLAGAGFAGAVATAMRAIVWGAADAGRSIDPVLKDAGIRSLAGVPLVLEGRLLGVLKVGSRSGREFTEHDIHLLEVAAERIALGITRNLAAQAQAMAVAGLEAASRAKDEFLALLSHELRSPLNAMLGWVNVMRLGGLSAERMADGLSRIERNVRLQAQLVQDLLDVSRIVSGKLTIDRQTVLLDRVVASVVESLGRQAEARGVRLDLDVPPASCTVIGDAGRLTQVLVNLVGNAIKFTPKDGIVTVTLREREQAAELEVRDTGEGIAAEFLPHLFHRFTQADAAANRKHGGLGLGLSIVQFLVNEHGGTVVARSDGKDRGAVFTVRLPLSGQPSLEASQQELLLSGPRLSGLKLVVVDDEADSRDSLALLLENEGGSIRTAASARAALAAIREDRPDVLVADLGMPGEDGFWLIDQVRRTKALRTLPAIALTGFAGRRDEARARGAGYQVHLAKPFDTETLVQTIVEIVRGSRRPPRRTETSSGGWPRGGSR